MSARKTVEAPGLFVRITVISEEVKGDEMESAHRGKPEIKYWFYSSDSMEKISCKFSRAFNSEIIDIDFENVYEWPQQTIGDM